MLIMSKISPIPPDFRISARTLRVVWDSMLDVVQAFAGLKFRGRKLGNEALVNVAVWHFAEMSRAEQESILREYLPRLERHLSDEPETQKPPTSANGKPRADEIRIDEAEIIRPEPNRTSAPAPSKKRRSG